MLLAAATDPAADSALPTTAPSLSQDVRARPRHSTASTGSSSLYGYVYPSAWQNAVSRREILKALANRVIFSGFYKLLYLSMTVLAAISIFLSFRQTCPQPGHLSTFITLELIINIIMIVEVSIRILAMGKEFWQALANWIDVSLVVICAVTLFLLIQGDCNDKSSHERVIADSILLTVRNLIQFIRIFHMMRKNTQNYTVKYTDIDFADAHSVERLSFDMEDGIDYPSPDVVVLGNNNMNSTQFGDDTTTGSQYVSLGNSLSSPLISATQSTLPSRITPSIGDYTIRASSPHRSSQQQPYSHMSASSLTSLSRSPALRPASNNHLDMDDDEDDVGI